MGQSQWVYLGSRLPRVLNTDSDYLLFERFVQKGEGNAESVKKALKSRLASEGKPLMISEENMSIGSFKGYPKGHPLTHSRRSKFDRLSDVLEGMDAVILVGIRSFRSAVFSAFVEYQEQWLRDDRSPLELLRSSDVMGMYHYASLRRELDARWPGRVCALDFTDIVNGCVSFPGFKWKASQPLPNTRQHGKVDGGVLREVVTKRPFLSLAKRMAFFSPKMAKRLWSVKRSTEVKVPHWDDEVWLQCADLETASENARKEWLGLSDSS